MKLGYCDVKVTVGMCVKNCEATIKQAIESVFNQRLPHKLTELIIVDCHSQDNTLKIVRDCLKKTDIQTRIFCENKGLGYARQMVVDNAEGEYIIWFDGDMVLSRDFVSGLVRFMEQNAKVGIAKGK